VDLSLNLYLVVQHVVQEIYNKWRLDLMPSDQVIKMTNRLFRYANLVYAALLIYLANKLL